ncbi:MAG: molybdopterin converting factor subunit 1 [Calditrichaeota bacterium]|nr:MAG: molybdopterin converting factor subunit 1 [Calditrichota bacterium]
MKVKLKFFAQLKEAARCSEKEVEMAAGARVADLARLLGEQFPEIDKYLNTVSFAVDNEYATPETPLHEGCEVALIPPISGG